MSRMISPVVMQRYLRVLGCAILFVCAVLYASPVRAHDKPHPPMPTIKPEPLVIPNMPPDQWGGARAHFLYSAAIGGIGTALAPEHKWKVLGVCIGIGVLKELRDRNRGQEGYKHGLFSRNDIKADAAGCMAGVGGVTLYRKEF